VAQANKAIVPLDEAKIFYMDLTPNFLAPDGTIPRELMMGERVERNQDTLPAAVCISNWRADSRNAGN
jgi:hypothetical protein